jgi:hypothetical protein
LVNANSLAILVISTLFGCYFSHLHDSFASVVWVSAKLVPILTSLLKFLMQIVQKTFVREDGQSMAPNQVAGEIMSFFTRNNFTVSDRGEVIT